MRDKLEIYRHLLEPHVEKMEEQIEPLAAKALHRDRDWYREQRGRFGDPFAELERIVIAAHKRQLEYASRRVALAAASEELAAEQGIEPAARELGGKEEMLDAYKREFGERDAKLIATRANYHRQFVKQQPERLAARSRQFAAPHPPRSELDQEISDWVQKNRGRVTALLALERAEQRTAELTAEREQADLEAAAVEPAAAPGKPAEPALEEGAVEWLSGPEINQRIEQRKQQLVPEYEQMPRRELSDKVRGLERDLLGRGRDIFDEAAQLEEERTPPIAPSEELLRRAKDADLGASAATDPVAREELKSKADYLRQQVREGRRWGKAVEDVQGRWVDLHAEEAALGLVSERSLNRAKEAEPAGGGIEF